jgi:predicted DNA-binding protein
MRTGGMRRSVTIRLKPALRQKLVRRAKQRGETPSELIRSLLEDSLNEGEEEDLPTLFELSEHLLGSVSSRRARPGRDVRSALEAWKPDRRG